MTQSNTQPTQDFNKSALSSTVVLPVLLLGLILVGVILSEAYSQQDHGDFWSVAVPGTLTGVGTLALAAATVWVSLRENRRDDYLRDRERRDVEAKDATLRDEEAAREAQKVLVNFHSPDRDVSITVHALHKSDVEITNAGTEPIVDVNVVGVTIKGKEKTEKEMREWGSISWDFDQMHMYYSHVLSGQSVWPGGSLIVNGGTPSGKESTKTVPLPDAVWKQMISVSIAWTDSAGRSWYRDGRTQPVKLDRPWELEDGMEPPTTASATPSKRT